MITKEDLKQKIDDVKTGKITQTEFLSYCHDNKNAVLKYCDSGTERFIVKNAIRTYEATIKVNAKLMTFGKGKK